MAQMLAGTKKRTRRLRRESTDAERRLWTHLRDHQLAGWGFRRQQAIPPYIVDLACVQAKLVIEIDGGQHADSARDKVRDRHLAVRGWRVLRFWNNDVLMNTEGVLLQILAALGPHPNPPPPAPRSGEGV